MYQMLSISHHYLNHISSNQGHISVIWEKHENADLSPRFQNSLHFELWTFSFLVLIPSPFWTSYTFWAASLKAYFDFNEFGLQSA